MKFYALIERYEVSVKTEAEWDSLPLYWRRRNRRYWTEVRAGDIVEAFRIAQDAHKQRFKDQQTATQVAGES